MIMVLDVLRSTPKDKIKPNIDDSGRQLSVNKCKHLDSVENYIELSIQQFPTIAVNTLLNYDILPSDITIIFMHENFFGKYAEPKIFISYAYYRDRV